MEYMYLFKSQEFDCFAFFADSEVLVSGHFVYSFAVQMFSRALSGGAVAK
jgi:hypothetical protein